MGRNRKGGKKKELVENVCINPSLYTQAQVSIPHIKIYEKAYTS